jgi:hypothetical protein
VVQMGNYDITPYSAGYSTPDIAEQWFENKLNGVKSKLELITAKIDERAQLKDRNINQILYDEVKVDNLMLDLPEYSQSERQALEKLNLNLSEQRRKEIVQAWKDVSDLYLKAIDAYIDLKNQNFKKDMLR